MDVKYDSQWGGWCFNEVLGHMGWVFGNSLGRGERNFLDVLHNVWCGKRPLKTVFLELYSISCLRRDPSVVDHLQFSNGSPQWNVNFVRVAHDWEFKLFSSFFD